MKRRRKKKLKINIWLVAGAIGAVTLLVFGKQIFGTAQMLPAAMPYQPTRVVTSRERAAAYL